MANRLIILDRKRQNELIDKLSTVAKIHYEEEGDTSIDFPDEDNSTYGFEI